MKKATNEFTLEERYRIIKNTKKPDGMYKVPIFPKTSITRNTSTQGEMLEKKIERMMKTKQPLEEGSAPLIFQERKAGVQASTDIRTDRFEIALDAVDKINASFAARRADKVKPKEEIGKTESIQGTEESPKI